MKRISARWLWIGAILLAIFIFPGCRALNPLCGSARPTPALTSLSATTITFADVQQDYVLTLTGTKFVGASVAVINGATLTTQVLSPTEIQVTITTSVVTAPGSVSVQVNTPSGNSGDLGCKSGGTSATLTLTVT